MPFNDDSQVAGLREVVVFLDAPSLDEQFNIGVTVKSLRHRLIKDFGYAWWAIGSATTT